MAGLNMFPPTPLEEDLGFGEQPKSPKRKSTTQAAGLAGLAPSYVDVSALREPQAFAVPELRTPSIAGVSATPSPSPFEAAAPAPTAPVELPPYIAYSPSVKKFFIGGQEVDAQNALEVDRAVSFLDAPSRPAPAKTATDWQPIAKDEFLAFRNALAAPRGFGEKLALGTQEIAASTVGGAGRAVELAGFPETGRAIASFAAEEIGPSTAEQTRSALIAENQGLLANITDAVVQGGLPSIGTTAVAGAAGFAVGGPLGAGIGIIGSIFFPELESSYSAAVQNGYDVNDPQVKAEILTATGAKTAVQSVFPAAIYRGLSRTFTQAAESAVAPAITKALTGRARAGAVTGAAITGGIQEGAAEGLATLVDSVAFDPEFRKMLSVNDWKAIAPYVAEKYGEDLLVSIGAGAFTAGPIGATTKFLETRQPTNLLQPASEVQGPPELQGPPTPVAGPPERQGPLERQGPPTPVAGPPELQGPPTPVAGPPELQGPPTPVAGPPERQGPPVPFVGPPELQGPKAPFIGPPQLQGPPELQGPPTPVAGPPELQGPPTPVAGPPELQGPPTPVAQPTAAPIPTVPQPTPPTTTAVPQPAVPTQGPVTVYENMGFFGKVDPDIANYTYNLLRAVGLDKTKILFGPLQDTKELANADPNTWAPQLGTDAALANVIRNHVYKTSRKPVSKNLGGLASSYAINGRIADTFIVRYNRGKTWTKERALESTAHEVGHVVQYTAYENATPAEKAAIKQAHLDHLKKADPKTYREFLNNFYPPNLAQWQIEGRTPTALSEQARTVLSAYERSFNEWFANQVARWAVSDRIPLTIVERFFKQIGDVYRKIFAQAKASGYVAPSMKAFLDARVPANFTIETIGLPQFTPSQRPLRTKKEKVNALKVRQVAEGGQQERIDVGTGLQEVRQDRNVAPVVAPSGTEAGGGNITPEGGQVAEQVTPPTTPTAQAARFSQLPPRPPQQPTQPPAQPAPPAKPRVVAANNVVAIGTSDPRYTGYISKLLGLTGLGRRRVLLVNMDEVDSIIQTTPQELGLSQADWDEVANFVTQNFDLRQLIDGGADGVAWMTSSGIGFIARRPSNKTLFDITTAAHEVGHLVKFMALHSASRRTQVAILQAHRDHLDRVLKTNPNGVPASLRTLIAEMRAPTVARKMEFRKQGGSQAELDAQLDMLASAYRIRDPKYFDYLTSFDEWFADQVSKWATTQRKPLTIVEEFFSRLGRRLKALFDAGRKEGLPDPTMKVFLDSLENANIGPSPFVAMIETLPPKPMKATQAPVSAMRASQPAPPTPDARDVPTKIEDFVKRNVPLSMRDAAARTAINIYTLAQKGVYGMSFGRDLVDMFVPMLPSANAYFDIVTRRATEARVLQQEVDRIMEKTGGFSIETRRMLNRFLANSTTSQKWGYQPTWKAPVSVDPTLAAEYQALPPEAATVADEIFKYGFETRTALRNAIQEEIEGDLTSAEFAGLSAEEQAQRKADVQRRLRLLDTSLAELQGPYAPLSRFGSYAIVGKSKEYKTLEAIPPLERSEEEKKRLQELKGDPDNYIVQFVSSAGEAQVAKSKLSAAFPDMEVEAFERKVLTADVDTMPWAGMLKLKTLVSNQFEGTLRTKEIEHINQLLTDMYVSALAENSARKHNLPRLAVAGFEADMLRSFVTKGKADAHFLASIKTSGDTASLLDQLSQEAKLSDAEGAAQGRGSRMERSKAFNELLQRHVAGITYNPTPVQDALMQFNSVWMLLSVPRYYIQNALQTYMMSLPVMAAKFGYKRSGSAITETYRDLVQSLDGKWGDFLSGKFDVTQMKRRDGKPYTQDEIQFLQDMRDSGRIDIGLSYDLGYWESYSENIGARTLQNVLHKMTSLTRQVEIANRLTAGMAAYRLAKAKGMEEFDARSYAAQILDQTQGDYSGANAPRLFSAVPLGKVVFQFRKYQIIQLSLLARNAYLAFKGASKEERELGRYVLAYVLGQTAVVTGALGLPLAGGIAYVLAAAFGEEEEPVDAERFLRSILPDNAIADLILKGVPAGLGVDVSNNFGFNTTFSILPYTDVDFTSRDALAKTLLGIGGPIMGTAANFADGFGYFAQGDYQKGAEMLLPNGLKHAMRAYREAFDEGVTRRNGDMVISADEFNTLQGMLQALGFSTTKMQNVRRKRQDIYEFEKFFAERTSQIRRDFVEARKAGDATAMAEAKAEWLALQRAKKRVNFKPTPLLNLYSAPKEQMKREQQYQERFQGLRD